MRLLITAIASLLVLGLGVADSAARCLSYDPAKVALVGTLTSRTFPGPPNYHSIARGDFPETVFLLRLDEPICVSGDPSSQRNQSSYSRITEVQILAGDAHPQHFLNKRVHAIGSLSNAHMSYHRTPVVLTVDKLRAP